jgi:hypothetical protein
VKDKLAAAGLPIAAPGRGDNGKVGDLTTPRTNAANTIQQRYFADVASKVALPMLKARNKPFVLVFWSRDPDGMQHNQRDSLNELPLGINGPTSAAAVRSADDNLEQLQDALGELGLADDADIVIAADHGFSTISKQSTTSPPQKRTIRMFRKASCRPDSWRSISRRVSGFPSSIPTIKSVRRAEERTTPRGNGLIGADPTTPDVGRVVEEALPNGAMLASTAASLRSSASAAGLQTVVEYQRVGSTRYFDAAGFPSRTIGLSEKAAGR